MHWLALLHSAPTEEGAPPAAAPQALAWWALQFTPRVARLEEAVVLEVGASLRLFGGPAALHRRVWREARDPAALGLPLAGMAWAPTSLAALALARAGQHDGLSEPLPALLDALPLAALSAARAHAAMLERLGCRCLGDLRALPRPALARRFGDGLLLALDRAYGARPEAHAWLSLPERFEQRLELPYRVEHSPALLHHAAPLLQQLCAWLAARQAGVKRLTLSWQHDAMRARDTEAGGALTLGTAEATRDLGHLGRLLGEHLAQTQLQAPAGELSLRADEVEALHGQSSSLLPDDPAQAREPLHQLLERVAVRLGPERVRRARLREDHRPERMQEWQAWQSASTAAGPATGAARGQVLPGRGSTTPPLQPQPSWLLDPPLRLATRQDRPLYLGELQILAGPQRIEGGWWDLEDRSAGDTEPGAMAAPPGQVQRDYFLARSERAGLLWIYQERLAADPEQAQAGWWLHGVFA